MSQGTMRANSSLPAQRTRSAPRTPPMTLGRAIQARSLRSLPTAWRKPQKADSEPGTRAMVEVALALTGSTPHASSDGKVMRVPPPASALTAPPSAPASASTNGVRTGGIASKIRDACMTRETPDEAERLKRALVARGYQPARAELEPLLALVMEGDRDSAEAASRALARLGKTAVAPALAALAAAEPGGRARLVRLVGRLAHQEHDGALAEAMGKVGGAAALARLDEAAAGFAEDVDGELRRVVDEARLKLQRTRE